MGTADAEAAPVLPRVIVVMGVSGSGKTVVGSGLATALGGRFAEGDRFHPSENIARMSAGMPLRDEDRWGWLDAIAVEIARAALDGEALVVACSALKRIYRDRLRRACPDLLFIHLDVDRDTAAARVGARKGHFMPASLIDSQFAASRTAGSGRNRSIVRWETSGRRAGRGGCCGASGRQLM